MRDPGWSRLSLILFVGGFSVFLYSVIPHSQAQTAPSCYPPPAPPGAQECCYPGPVVPPIPPWVGLQPCPCWTGPGPNPSPFFRSCACYPGPAPVPPGFSGPCPCAPSTGYPPPTGFRSCPCYPGPPPVPPNFSDSCPCYPGPGPAPPGFRVCACYPGPGAAPPGFRQCPCYPGPAPVPPNFSMSCPCYPGPAPIPPGFRNCTAQQIASLSGLLASFRLPKGTGNSLMAKIQAVQSSFERGNTRATCGQLNALINETEAQLKNRTLTVAQATALINAAQTARGMLGCK